MKKAISQLVHSISGKAVPHAETRSALETPEMAGSDDDLRVSTSYRRKLWEIPHKCHCPVIGVCFSCTELRTLMRKTLAFPENTGDYVLHSTAVGHCEERTRLSELLHKTLEKRYKLAIQKAGKLKSASELRAFWQEACATPGEIPAALWVVWTHSACDSRLVGDVYADIHMIQHQVGAGHRVDARTVKRLTQENAELQAQLQAARKEIEALRQEKQAAERVRQNETLELRAELVAKAAWGLDLQQQFSVLQQSLPDLAERQVLSLQRDELQQQVCVLKRRLLERELEIARLREFASQAEAAMSDLTAAETCSENPLACDLAGKCVLCVGGRPGAVSAYRESVERSGGRFMHHDGGLEDSLHRIDGVVAAADVVICQTGCISHNAYWKVKDLCKRTGKTCMFVKVPGVGSFERSIEFAKKTR